MGTNAGGRCAKPPTLNSLGARSRISGEMQSWGKHLDAHSSVHENAIFLDDSLPVVADQHPVAAPVVHQVFAHLQPRSVSDTRLLLQV